MSSALRSACPAYGWSAVRNLLGGDEAVSKARTPDIMAEAAHAILTRDSRARTGYFFINDEVPRAEGVADLAPYRLGGTEEELDLDFFLPDAPLPARSELSNGAASLRIGCAAAGQVLLISLCTGAGRTTLITGRDWRSGGVPPGSGPSRRPHRSRGRAVRLGEPLMPPEGARS